VARRGLDAEFSREVDGLGSSVRVLHRELFRLDLGCLVGFEVEARALFVNMWPKVHDVSPLAALALGVPDARPFGPLHWQFVPFAALKRPQLFVSKCESGERHVHVVELVAFCNITRPCPKSFSSE
jgi:hypothetical protein